MVMIAFAPLSMITPIINDKKLLKYFLNLLAKSLFAH